MRLIGLTGSRRSGKDAVANILARERGFQIVRFSGPLKDMLRAIGLTEDEIDGVAKELPCAKLMGTTPRHAMQTLGTEWGREMIHKDLWLNLWRMQVEERIEERIEAEIPVVTPDVRFRSEAALIHEMGGEVWRVTRPGYDGTGHVSETEMLEYECEAEIVNDGDLKDLEAKVLACLTS